MRQFGHKLRTLRIQRGLSLRRLASDLGLATHSHLDRIERGLSQPSPALILRIAEYFGVSTDDLMNDGRTIGSES